MSLNEDQHDWEWEITFMEYSFFEYHSKKIQIVQYSTTRAFSQDS